MSDEQQDLNLEDVGAGTEEAAGQRRGGLLSGMVLTILKWAAIGIGVIIIVVTTTVITVRVVNKGAAQTGLAVASPAYTPKSEPLATFDGLDQIRGQTADDPPAIFLLQLSLGYDSKDVDFSVEIGNRKHELQDIILKDISQRTADELTATHWEELQADLLARLNTIMTTGKLKGVMFLSFIVQK